MVMFPNNGLEAVEQSFMKDEIEFREKIARIPKLRMIWDASEVRRMEAANLQSMYDQDWEAQLLDELESRFRYEVFQKLKLTADFSLNLVFWVIRKLAGIYKKEAIRTLVEDPKSDRFQEVLRESAWDMTMLEVNRLTTLHRDLLVGPFVQSQTDGSRRIRFRILTPDVFDVIARDNDPTMLDAIMYATWRPDAKGIDQRHYFYWDRFFFYEFDHRWKRVMTPGNPDAINPFGRIPFVAFHATLPTRRFWHYEQARGIRKATLNVGTALTDLWHALKHNSFKQLALSGEGVDQIDPGALLDAASALDLGVSGKAQVLDMAQNFQDRIKSIFDVVALIVHTYGIQPKSFRGTLDGQSGYAIELQERDLVDAHDEQRRLYPVFEQELYDVVRVVNNANQTFDDGDGMVEAGFDELPVSTMRVEYADIGPGQSPKETLDFWKTAVESQLSTHVRALMNVHSMTEDEAVLEFERILVESDLMSPVPRVPILAPPPAPLVDDDDDSNRFAAPAELFD